MCIIQNFWALFILSHILSICHHFFRFNILLVVGFSKYSKRDIEQKAVITGTLEGLQNRNDYCE